MTDEVLITAATTVADRLIHLGGADYDEDKNQSAADIMKTGSCARDAGIEEWDWPQGVGLYGLIQLQDHLGDHRYSDFLHQWFARNIAEGLPSKNINTTAPYLTLLQILDEFPEGSKERTDYEQMCRERAQWLMEDLPKTKDNGFQHVTTALGDRNGVILNEGQLWLDTLFMACLFLQQAGNRYRRTDWQQEAIHQALVHIKYLYDKNTGLFYHGYSFLRHDNFGAIHWCRGNSWFTYGITMLLEHAKDMDAATCRFITETFTDHVEALTGYLAEDGLFHTIIDDPSSYEESSGTAAIAAGVLHGIRTGILDHSYKAFADRMIEGLLACIAPDGTVEKVSAGTAMGMDADHYKGIIVKPMAYGQALTLLALCEALAV